MTRAIVVALGTGAFITSAAALSVGSTTGHSAQEMSAAEYRDAVRLLEDSRRENLLRCEGLAAADKDLCRTEVQASDLVRVAELEQGFRRNEQSSRALQRARIDARYQLDRARCGTLGGFKREKCLVQAHAARGRALLDASAPYEGRAAKVRF